MSPARAIAFGACWIVDSCGAGAADGVEFFELKVRPLLADHCFSCHGEEKQKGKLRLDSPAAIRAGGESGAEFLPGEPEKSRIITAVG